LASFSCKGIARVLNGYFDSDGLKDLLVEFNNGTIVKWSEDLDLPFNCTVAQCVRFGKNDDGSPRYYDLAEFMELLLRSRNYSLIHIDALADNGYLDEARSACMTFLESVPQMEECCDLNAYLAIAEKLIDLATLDDRIMRPSEHMALNNALDKIVEDAKVTFENSSFAPCCALVKKLMTIYDVDRAVAWGRKALQLPRPECKRAIETYEEEVDQIVSLFINAEPTTAISNLLWEFYEQRLMFEPSSSDEQRKKVHTFDPQYKLRQALASYFEKVDLDKGMHIHMNVVASNRDGNAQYDSFMSLCRGAVVLGNSSASEYIKSLPEWRGADEAIAWFDRVISFRPWDADVCSLFLDQVVKKVALNGDSMEAHVGATHYFIRRNNISAALDHAWLAKDALQTRTDGSWFYDAFEDLQDAGANVKDLAVSILKESSLDFDDRRSLALFLSSYGDAELTLEAYRDAAASQWKGEPMGAAARLYSGKTMCEKLIENLGEAGASELFNGFLTIPSMRREGELGLGMLMKVQLADVQTQR
jgi:tetratricopeptide (TPR) repeat protein